MNCNVIHWSHNEHECHISVEVIGHTHFHLTFGQSLLISFGYTITTVHLQNDKSELKLRQLWDGVSCKPVFLWWEPITWSINMWKQNIWCLRLSTTEMNNNKHSQWYLKKNLGIVPQLLCLHAGIPGILTITHPSITRNTVVSSSQWSLISVTKMLDKELVTQCDTVLYSDVSWEDCSWVIKNALLISDHSLLNSHCWCLISVLLSLPPELLQLWLCSAAVWEQPVVLPWLQRWQCDQEMCTADTWAEHPMSWPVLYRQVWWPRPSPSLAAMWLWWPVCASSPPLSWCPSVQWPVRYQVGNIKIATLSILFTQPQHSIADKISYVVVGAPMSRGMTRSVPSRDIGGVEDGSQVNVSLVTRWAMVSMTLILINY